MKRDSTACGYCSGLKVYYCCVEHEGYKEPGAGSCGVI